MQVCVQNPGAAQVTVPGAYRGRTDPGRTQEWERVPCDVMLILSTARDADSSQLRVPIRRDGVVGPHLREGRNRAQLQKARTAKNVLALHKHVATFSSIRRH